MGDTWVRMAHGGYGSRSGRAWTVGYVVDRDHAESGVMQHDSAGVNDPTVPPSIRAMQDAIKAEACPFCHRGPFKNLGMHTNRTHGVSASELREMSGLDRVCSDALSDGSRERLLARPDREEFTKRGNEESVRRGSYRVAAAARVNWWRKTVTERDVEICQRAASGELLIDIAKDLGVHTKTVREALERHGVEQDKTALRESRRKRLSSNMESARQASQSALDDERRRRHGRFVELGSDWDALVTLASEVGVSNKAMRAYLAKDGLVLDGRVMSPRRGRQGPLPAIVRSECSVEGCERDYICRGMCRKHYQQWKRANP